MIKLLCGTRHEKETSRAITACNDYLRLGPGRSVAKLWKKYRAYEEIKPPSRNNDVMEHWCADYGWVERAAQYDAQVEDEKETRRREIMETGLALDYERVCKLKIFYDLLEKELSQGALWLEDAKQIGGGKFAERVDLLRYNSAIVSDIRGILDDIARETGGRVNKHDMHIDFSKMSDDEIKRFILERLGSLSAGS